MLKIILIIIFLILNKQLTLNISYETVHSHIRKIYQKLQVNSVGEAVSKTISKNILRMLFF
ncbi:MAG TPA: LuxR C-terminal-related transcriptional regulator [Bacteroidia bacterium]|nr:LuxR C-terminal-related transcriptional regulator [Bacteroidia bacterium]